MKKTCMALGFIATCIFHSPAQETWDLQRCINHAIEHNLNIKQKEERW